MYSIEQLVLFENIDHYVDIVIKQDDYMRQKLITMVLIHQIFLLKIIRLKNIFNQYKHFFTFLLKVGKKYTIYDNEFTFLFSIIIHPNLDFYFVIRHCIKSFGFTHYILFNILRR